MKFMSAKLVSKSSFVAQVARRQADGSTVPEYRVMLMLNIQQKPVAKDAPVKKGETVCLDDETLSITVFDETPEFVKFAEMPEGSKFQAYVSQARMRKGFVNVRFDVNEFGARIIDCSSLSDDEFEFVALDVDDEVSVEHVKNRDAM